MLILYNIVIDLRARDKGLNYIIILFIDFRRIILKKDDKKYILYLTGLCLIGAIIVLGVFV